MEYRLPLSFIRSMVPVGVAFEKKNWTIVEKRRDDWPGVGSREWRNAHHCMGVGTRDGQYASGINV